MRTFYATSESAQAYDVLAPHYDAFTAHHDYPAWTRGLLDLAAAHGLSEGSCLDVGCGTGRSLQPLLDAGWRGVGCDVSAAMLACCATAVGDRAALHHLDARELPALGEFDLVWALDDVVNYMLDAEDVVALLRGMAANLAPDGLVVFDANTLWTYRTFFASQAVCDTGSSSLTWRGLAGAGFADGCLAEALLDVFVERDGRWERRTTRHRQRHHGFEQISECLAAAGLQLAAAYGQFPDVRFERRPDETRHSKAIYVARLAHNT